MPSGLCSYVAGSSGNAPGTVYRDVLIPNTRDGGNHPHPVNILVPDGSHSAAIIILHGGGGTSTNILRSLGLVASPDGVTWGAKNVAWGYPATFGNLVIASPQGWVDPLTYSTTNPNGVASWTNYHMNSRAPAAGWDDVQMLKDLATFLRGLGGLVGVNLCGHSNGGMMVNRMLLESPNTFSHYCSCAGPLPSRWLSYPYTLPQKPYFEQFGGQDTTINLLGSGGIYSDSWQQTVDTLSQANDNYPALSSWIGAWKALPERYAAYSLPAPAKSDAVITSVTSGLQYKWTSSNGKIVLQYLQNSEHEVASYQKVSGRKLFVDWCRFIVNT